MLKRLIIYIIKLFLWANTPAALAYAEDFPNYDNFIVVEAKLGELVYGDVLDAYDYNLDGKNIYLHFEQFTKMLDFPLKINKTDNNNFNINGWFIRLENKIDIDSAKLPENSYFFDEEDLYINVNLLSKWFPIELTYDEFYGSLEITPQENLPFQEKRIREKKRSLWASREKKQEYPIYKSPITFLKQAPMADIKLSSAYSKKGGLKSNFSSLIATDINPLNVQLNINGGNDKINNISFLGQRDFTNNYIKQFKLGDISPSSGSIVKIDGRDYGVSFSNFDTSRAQNFDKIDIKGTAKEGWEVEIYNNNELQDFKIIDASEYYEFNDININYGENKIRKVLYGPQGEIIEETDEYYVDSSLIKVGDFNYNSFLYNIEKPTFGFNSLYGLGSNISTKQALYASEDSVKILAGANIAYSEIVANIEGYFDIKNSDSQIKATALTRFDNLALRFEQTFFSEQDNNKFLKTTASLNGAFGLLGKNISASLRADYNLFEDSSWDLNINNRLTANLWGISANNNLNISLSESSEIRASGLLSLRERLANDIIKLDLNYDILPSAELNSINALWQHNFASNFNSRLNASYAMNSGNFGIGLGLNYQNQDFITGIQTSYNTNGDYSIMANLSFSLYQDPINKDINVTSHNVAATGLISAAGFLDKNYDDIKNADEELIKQLTFERGGSVFRANESDIATIMPTGGRENIAIVEDSSPDPMIIASKLGYNVKSRAGHVTELLFPLIETSEIEGLIETDNGLAVGGITLYLYDKEGNRVKEFTSEHDGYFFTDRIKPGEYYLTASSEDLEKINHTIEENISFTVEKGTNFYDNIIITLQSPQHDG